MQNIRKLNAGAYNVKRKFDGKETTFIYDTPKKNGCVYILEGEWAEKNGLLYKSNNAKQTSR